MTAFLEDGTIDPATSVWCADPSDSPRVANVSWDMSLVTGTCDECEGPIDDGNHHLLVVGEVIDTMPDAR